MRMLFEKPVQLKRKFIEVCAAALVLLAPVKSQADDYYNGLTYSSDTTGVTITGYADSGVAVTIPSSINGLPVTSIANQAFSECTRLPGVTLPDSVTNIGCRAFYYCSSLTNIVIGSGVIIIGDYAFSECTCLTNVTLPNSVTYIGDGAFNNCASLTNIVIGSGVTFIGDYAFGECSRLIGVTLPDSVASIREGTFADCSRLTNVIIPSSVTNIGNFAFSGCARLTGVAIPASVASVGDYAFSWCSNLTSVIIPSHVTSMGQLAFSECDRLSSVYFSGDTPTEAGDSIFDGSIEVAVYVLAEASGWSNTFSGRLVVVETAASCFSWLTNNSTATLTRFAGSNSIVVIPHVFSGLPVVSIGENAFSNCLRLTSMTIPDTVTNIGKQAFVGCSNLASVTISEDVSSIGDRAFANCANLTSIRFKGNAPAKVGADVFSGSTVAIVYSSSLSTGWSSTLCGRPVVVETDSSCFSWESDGSTVFIARYTGSNGLGLHSSKDWRLAGWLHRMRSVLALHKIDQRDHSQHCHKHRRRGVLVLRVSNQCRDGQRRQNH